MLWCPLCRASIEASTGVCSCGYDTHEVAALGMSRELYAGYAFVRTRIIERQLRATRTPKPLPEARLR